MKNKGLSFKKNINVLNITSCHKEQFTVKMAKCQKSKIIHL